MIGDAGRGDFSASSVGSGMALLTFAAAFELTGPTVGPVLRLGFTPLSRVCIYIDMEA